MSKLAAFAAGFGGGYLNAKQRVREEERQDKLDAMQEEQFNWARERAAAERRDRENKEAIERAVTDAGKAGQVEQAAGVTYTNDAGDTKTAYQPDMATAEFAAQQDALERGLPMPGVQQLKANEDGTTSPVETPAPTSQATAATSVRSLDGSRRLFTGLTAASDAAKFAQDNPTTPYAKYMALSEKLAGMAGGQELADKYLERAKKAEKEGAFQTLNLLEAGDTAGALKAWNSTGAVRLQPGQSFRTVEQGGRKVHQVVEGDKVIVADAESALLRYISGIEGVAAQAKARADSIAKRQEELLKPYTLRPGERREVFDPASGKTVTLSQGNIPAGYEVLTDPQGNTVLRKMDGGGRGTGTGTGSGTSGKAPKEFVDQATDLLKDGLGKTDGTPEGAQRYTRAISFLDGIYAGNPGMSPRTAAAIAADASADPSKVTPQIDNKTGLIGKVYSNPDFDGGRQYNLAPAGATPAEMEKAVGKTGMVKAVGGMLDTLVAPVPEDQRMQARTQLIQVAADPALRKAYLDAAQAAGKDVTALQRQLDLVKQYAAPAKDAPRRDAPPPAPPLSEYRPPADSPAGRMLARREAARAEEQKREQERSAAQQDLSKQFQADKARLSPEEMSRKYDPVRRQLPLGDAGELQQIERQIR